jgi:hypothetical protein
MMNWNVYSVFLIICGNLSQIVGTINSLIFKVDSISGSMRIIRSRCLSTTLTLLRLKLKLVQFKQNGSEIRVSNSRIQGSLQAIGSINRIILIGNSKLPSRELQEIVVTLYRLASYQKMMRTLLLYNICRPYMTQFYLIAVLAPNRLTYPRSQWRDILTIAKLPLGRQPLEVSNAWSIFIQKNGWSPKRPKTIC